MNKKIFSTVDLKDFKDRFKKSKVSNDKRLQELVEYVADKKEIPKKLTFEEYKYIRKLLLMSKKLDKQSSTSKPKEEVKEEPKTTKTETPNTTDKDKTTKSKKSTTNSKSTTKKDSGSSKK